MKRIHQMEPWVGEEEKEELIKTIDSGWVTEAGRTRQFEQVFAQYVGSKYAAAVNNGTVSLTIALLALGVGRGDEVIVPDFTMIASANSVKLAGAEPVLVDIEPLTLALDPEAVERAITPRTRAIMPVPLNGRPPNMERLMQIAKRHHLFVVEDAAQALGCRCGSKHLGTFGEIGSFSLSTPKVITTGQGGMLVTDDQSLSEKIVRLKDFGRLNRSDFFHEALGYNFKFTDLQAALGLAQMKKLEWRVNRKKEMFRLYQRQLQGLPGVEFVATNLEETSPWFLDILVEASLRDDLAQFLNQRGIGTRPFYPPLHLQPPYSYVKGPFPVSESLTRRGLWLPSSTFLSDEDIARVCTEIRSYFVSRR